MVQFNPFLCGKKAEVPDFDEALWQNMLKEPSEELEYIQRTGFECFVFSILVLKRYPVIFHIQNISI
jgi:hypothetical protein